MVVIQWVDSENKALPGYRPQTFPRNKIKCEGELSEGDVVKAQWNGRDYAATIISLSPRFKQSDTVYEVEAVVAHETVADWEEKQAQLHPVTVQSLKLSSKNMLATDLLFRVRWFGYTDQDDTLEPRENLVNVLAFNVYCQEKGPDLVQAPRIPVADPQPQSTTLAILQTDSDTVAPQLIAQSPTSTTPVSASTSGDRDRVQKKHELKPIVTAEKRASEQMHKGPVREMYQAESKRAKHAHVSVSSLSPNATSGSDARKRKRYVHTEMYLKKQRSKAKKATQEHAQQEHKRQRLSAVRPSASSSVASTSTGGRNRIDKKKPSQKGVRKESVWMQRYKQSLREGAYCEKLLRADWERDRINKEQGVVDGSAPTFDYEKYFAFLDSAFGRPPQLLTID